MLQGFSQAFVITLREGLEAFLIVAISLSYLRKTGRAGLTSAVRWGVVVALAISAVGGYLLFDAANQEWLDGPLALVAAVSVTWMIVHMWRTGRRMKGDIEGRLQMTSVRPGRAAFAGVFLFTALMVTREGMESALLLIQLRETIPLAIGATTGLLGAAGLAWLWSRYGHRVNLALFFQVTAVFLIVFVVQLTIAGFHEMAEQNFLPYSTPIHEATEAWGPDSGFGHLLTYLLAILPLAWLLVASFSSKGPVFNPPTPPSTRRKKSPYNRRVKSPRPADAPKAHIRPSPAEAPVARRRLRYIDWARAVAILVMVEAHTVDSWIRPELRSTHAFRNLLVLGGLAAPLFLWLAGLSVVLSAERTFQRTGSQSSATSAICKRGLEIFVLAFLFRLQAFIVSPGSPLVMLFKVDILNVMGPAIVAAGLVWGLLENRAALTIGYSLAAVGVAMVTPMIRVADWVASMPTWVQWYMRPNGDYTTFTAFPWCGFVFAGAALGAIIARRPGVRSEWRLQGILAVAGGAILQLGLFTASLPTIYRASSFWTSSPTYFAVRVGVMMLGLAALYFVDVVGVRWVSDTHLTPIERLGRASLFIYWIHMELVYGYVSKALWRRLSLAQWTVAYAAFCVILYGLLVLKDRLVEYWGRDGHILPYDLKYAQEARKNR